MFTNKFMEVPIKAYQKTATGDEVEEYATGWIDPDKIVTFYAMPEGEADEERVIVDLVGANAVNVYMSVEDFRERVNNFMKSNYDK